MSSLDPSPQHTPAVSSTALAVAAEERASRAVPQRSSLLLNYEYEKRQKFRRMIDPGIVRPNPKNQALQSLNTLLKIAENLIRDPNNEKYHRFKPTNHFIKRDLMDPRGTLEYAREMGFQPQVVDFQPYYVFDARFMEDLKLGAMMLKDYLDLISEKQTRDELAKKNEKAMKEEELTKIKLAFMDDRKRKELRDQLEKEKRQAHGVPSQAESATSSRPMAGPVMPGSGHTLSTPCAEDDEQMTLSHGPTPCEDVDSE